MPAVSRPLVDPSTTDPKGQYAILAHDQAQKLLKGSGTQHARVRALQTTLEELAMQNYQEGAIVGARQERAALRAALVDVHAHVAGVNAELDVEAPSPATLKRLLLDAMAALAPILAQCEEAAHVEEALKEAQVAPPPEAEPPPIPPAGLHVYRATLGIGGVLELGPMPASTFSLENCVVWTNGRWVGWAGSNAALPCWIAAKIKPKG